MTTDQLSTAFPEVRTVLERARAAPTMNRIGLTASRENARKRTSNPPREEVAVVDERVVPTTAGGFKVRVYRPKADGVLPLVLYFHAGGWILGDLDHSDHLCRRLANRAGAVVVNVDYRLAPEHRYPAALDDCESALRWACEQAKELGIDVDRVAIAGESSGGNLAAALALRGLRVPMPAVAYVMLIAPALDAAMDTASWAELGSTCIPAREQMAWMWEQYLPNADAARDPEANPAVATQLAGHPQVLVISAELDPLRDEARHYADKLADADVKTEWRLERGLMHAFSNLGGVIPQGLDAFDRAVASMKRAFDKA